MELTDVWRATMEMFRPPSNISVAEWADRYRMIAGKSNAEPGPWRTDRAPYQREIMNAATQKGVHKIVMMTSAQCGKTDMTLNMICRMIDCDPGPALLVLPAEDDTENYSKERLTPTLEITPRLRKKIYGGHQSTITNKAFPGGFLAMAGANSPGGLKSRPVRYLFLDEVDGYPINSGGEGDPVRLAEKRTQNFFNRLVVMTSTPKLKETSVIYREFLRGTQEEWEIRCAHCGEYSPINFDDIRFTKHIVKTGDTDMEFQVDGVSWSCPKCREEMQEHDVKTAPGRWTAGNPEALEKGVRSFHLTAFSSPWSTWKELVKRFLDAKDDPFLLQTFYNTDLGLPFERTYKAADADEMYERREKYKAEVPNGVLVLTMGMDTQDNRLEYEVVGWGREEESWGIQRGVIPGRADDPETWEQVDALLDRQWEMENGKTLRIAVTFIDSGGHFTDSIYRECARRLPKRVFPIKGANRDTGPLVRHTQTKHGGLLIELNVSVGKEAVLYAARVDKPGRRYMHFPDSDEAGYDEYYFKGLISERLEKERKRGQDVLRWVKIYERNEPLDMRNYARCAFKSVKINLDDRERKLYGEAQVRRASTAPGKKRPKGLISEGVKV